MRALVLDASAVLEYLLRSDRGTALKQAVTADDADLHVPALCDLEVAATIRKLRLAVRMNDARADEILRDYLDLRIARHGHASLLARALELRFNFTVYDASYVALAERLHAALVTADRPLARAARLHTDLEVLEA